MTTPEEYFKKWSENCRVFTDYKPIHSHEDMMRFAKDYHKQQMKSIEFTSKQEAIEWVQMNTPFAVKPKRKAKTVFVSPFKSLNGFESVVNHLGEKLYLRQNKTK